jgi:hypothetical protein
MEKLFDTGHRRRRRRRRHHHHHHHNHHHHHHHLQSKYCIANFHVIRPTIF